MTVDYHHDFWVASATAGPVLALAIARNINRYFIAPIAAALQPYKASVWGDNEIPPRAVHLRLARRSQISFNIVAWIGFSLTALVTVTALLSLAWTRDILGDHHGMIWAVIALVVAGATLPILGLIERKLGLRLRAVGMELKTLRESVEPPWRAVPRPRNRAAIDDQATGAGAAPPGPDVPRASEA